MLRLGHGCIIDRMGLTPDQRVDFIRCAASLQCPASDQLPACALMIRNCATLCGAQAHVLVLQLDAELAATRAAQRKGHEGGLNGQKGYGLSKRASADLRAAGLPKLQEGLASVTVSGMQFDVHSACMHDLAA